MNLEITKYKNQTSSDMFNKRLMRLERMMQMVIELSGSAAQNPNNSLINENLASNGGNVKGKLLAELASMAKSTAKNGVAGAGSFTIRPQVNNDKSGVGSLLLSHGQIISQIASAIAMVSQRNS